MLVRVTEKCDMGCIHCSVDATPEGQHMSLDMYRNVLKYLRNLQLPLIMLTGGEPTQHPDIIEMIYLAKQSNIEPWLMSNGTFLENDTLKKRIIHLDIKVQITNDPRYYPRRIPIIENSNFVYEDKVRFIAPFHRALTNNIPITSKLPNCFNIRSLSRYPADCLQTAIMGLTLYGKFCTPSINFDGTISVGESNSCTTIGTVTDNFNSLFNNLRSMTCSRCKRVYNLTDPQKRAIGEL